MSVNCNRKVNPLTTLTTLNLLDAIVMKQLHVNSVLCDSIVNCWSYWMLEHGRLHALNIGITCRF